MMSCKSYLHERAPNVAFEREKGGGGDLDKKERVTRCDWAITKFKRYVANVY